MVKIAHYMKINEELIQKKIYWEPRWWKTTLSEALTTGKLQLEEDHKDAY